MKYYQFNENVDCFDDFIEENPVDPSRPAEHFQTEEEYNTALFEYMSQLLEKTTEHAKSDIDNCHHLLAEDSGIKKRQSIEIKELKAKVKKLKIALRSIADNTCQNASLVARSCLVKLNDKKS